MWCWVLILVLVCSLGYGDRGAWAQESAPAGKEKVEVLEELTVTATRTERLRSEVPASVTVITKKQIAQSPEKNLDEILRQEAGVSLARRNSIAVGIPIRLDVRGVPGPNRTLVLVDGYPINGSGTGFVNFQQVPLESIERVEIVRGPYSALYGANALGGVINIITKEKRGRPDIAVYGGGGTYSWYQAGIMSGGGDDSGRFFVNVDTRRTHNYYFGTTELVERFNRVTNRSTIDGVPSVNRFYNDWRYVGNFTFSPHKTTSVTLNTRYFNNQTGLGRTDNLNPNRDEENWGETFFGGVTIKSVPSDRLGLLFKVYYRQFTDKLWNETSFLRTIVIPQIIIRRGPRLPPIIIPARTITVPGFGPGYLKQVYTDYQVAGQFSYVLGKHQTFTGGFDVLGVDVRFNSILNADTMAPFPGSSKAIAQITTTGFYLQDEISLGKFRIIPGVRLDKHSLFDPVVSPKFGLSYQLTEDTVLRTSVGRAYRAPSVTELFRPEWNLNPFVRLAPNPELKPEYIWSVDAGLEHRFSPTLRVSLDGFYNSMKDFIITQAVPGSPGKIRYENLADSWSGGAEATVEWRPRDWLTFFANYTFLQSNDKVNRVRITNLPDHRFNVGLRFDKKWRDWRFYGSLIESFVGDQTVQPLGTTSFTLLKSYFTTDVALFANYKEIVTLGLKVQNLFDAKYMDTYGYYGPGRSLVFCGGLRYQF